MDVWRAYIDESYNAHVFCVGGFLAPEERWVAIEDQWGSRIHYENEKSALGGFPPITRYHATDCAGLKSEFSTTNGWDIARQIKLTKRLCEILDDARPIGLVVGGRIADMKKYLGNLPDCPKESLYDLCFRMSLLFIVATMRDNFKDAVAEVTIDQSKKFGQVARNGFAVMKADEDVPYLKDCFTELHVRDSKTCLRLQAADFMAYEAMRQLEVLRQGKDTVRKSMGAIIGTDIPLQIAQFNDQNFADFTRMVENKKAGRPTGEGIASGLGLPITSGHRLAHLP